MSHHKKEVQIALYWRLVQMRKKKWTSLLVFLGKFFAKLSTVRTIPGWFHDYICGCLTACLNKGLALA